MFHHLAQLLWQFCQFPISPGRTRQRVEQLKSKSTKPSSPSRSSQFECNLLLQIPYNGFEHGDFMNAVEAPTLVYEGLRSQG